MKRIFFSLFLFLLFSQAYCEKCTNSAPFIKYLTYGYDLAEFDIYGCPYIGGRKSKIADYSDCSDGQKFKMADQEKTEYQVPDAVARVAQNVFSSVSSGDINERFDSFFHSYIENRVFNSFPTRIVDSEKYLYRKSDYVKVIKKMFDTGNSVGVIPYDVREYVAIPKPIHYDTFRKFISKQFLIDANALPKNYTGNEGKYEEFITKYGTHHIINGRFGGIIHRIIPLKNSLTDKDARLREVRKDSFIVEKDIEIKCEKQNGSRRVQKLFDSKGSFMQIVVGGFADHKLFVNRSIPLETMMKNPALVSAEMEPIAELIPKTEEEKRESLRRAIKIHLIRATNEAFLNIIDDYLKVVSASLDSQLLLLKIRRSQSSYDENELSQINEDIERVLSDVSLKMTHLYG